MRPLSIRARLSLWYCGVMAATLALFALIAFNAMRRSMVAAVDEELRDRIAGFQALLSNRAGDDDDFLQVLLEHSGGGDQNVHASEDGTHAVDGGGNLL